MKGMLLFNCNDALMENYVSGSNPLLDVLQPIRCGNNVIDKISSYVINASAAFNARTLFACST